MKKAVAPILLSCAALVSDAPSAAAGGLFVPGYGSQSQPRAGAFVAKADDPTAILHNPAGLRKVRGTQVHLGFNFVDMHLRYQRAGTYDEVAGEDLPWEGQPYAPIENEASPDVGFAGIHAIPLFALSHELRGEGAPPITLAAGIYAGHGYPEREFAPDYQIEADPSRPPPPNRYDILALNGLAAYPSIAAAYSITDDLDVGVRASWGFASFQGRTSVWAFQNYEETEANDGLFSVNVEDGFVPTFGLGLTYRPLPALEIGAAYRSKSSIRGKGTGHAVLGSAAAELGGDSLEPIQENPRCESGGTAVNLKTCVDFVLPQEATLGARWVWRDGSGRERGDLELDLQWEDWSDASDIDITVDARSALGALNTATLRHGFQDVLSVRLGGSYNHPVGAHLLSVRAGVAHDTATAPESWTRVDIDGMARTTLGAGLAYETSSMRFELGGGAVLEGTRDVPLTCNPTAQEPGCAPGGGENDEEERTAPDPAQPLNSPSRQVESPFNAGTYEQGYVLVSAGVTAWF